MNDDFLRQLRRPPSATFERQLRERLRDQESPEPAKRRPSWKLLMIAMLMGGTALATATYLTMSRAPSQPSPAPEVTSASPTSPAQSTTRPDGQLSWRTDNTIYATQSVATSSPTATSAEQTTFASSTRASNGSSEEASATGAVRASGALSIPGSETSRPPVIRIAVTPDIESIVKDTLPKYSSMSSAALQTDSPAPAIRALCTGSAEHSDILISSQRITKNELYICNAPAVGGVFEATLGHAAAVVTGARTGTPMQLSRDALLRAILKRIPSPDNPSALIDNPYTRWNQIDASLENRRIEIFGPAHDSPEFHVFAAALLEPACDKYPGIQALQHTDRKAYEEICFSLREDGVYQQTRLDGMFVRQRLWSDPNIVAVVDYPFYFTNSADLLGSLLTGAPATRESLVNGSYGAMRTLYLYIPRWRYQRDSRVKQFVDEYLRMRGVGTQRPLTQPDGGTEWRARPEPVPLIEVK